MNYRNDSKYSMSETKDRNGQFIQSIWRMLPRAERSDDSRHVKNSQSVYLFELAVEFEDGSSDSWYRIGRSARKSIERIPEIFQKLKGGGDTAGTIHLIDLVNPARGSGPYAVSMTPRTVTLISGISSKAEAEVIEAGMNMAALVLMGPALLTDPSKKITLGYEARRKYTRLLQRYI